jgi:hypothetical protein
MGGGREATASTSAVPWRPAQSPLRQWHDDAGAAAAASMREEAREPPRRPRALGSDGRRPAFGRRPPLESKSQERVTFAVQGAR